MASADGERGACGCKCGAVCCLVSLNHNELAQFLFVATASFGRTQKASFLGGGPPREGAHCFGIPHDERFGALGRGGGQTPQKPKSLNRSEI